MSADSTRLARSSDFTRTLDKGVRVSSRDLLISIAPLPVRWPDPTGVRTEVASFGGPRLGLIVSKKVGNAVVRHTVARYLRHAFAATRTELPATDAYVVVRARPSAAVATTVELTRQLGTAFASPKVAAAFDLAGLP